MTRRRAILWIVGLAILATAIYAAIRQTRDLTDFEVYRTAGARLLDAAPLYRAEDGHFVFKYLPAFAFGLVPFAEMSAEAAKAAWYALSFASLVAFVSASVWLLPERRRTPGAVLALTLLVTARLDIRELSLGQTNVLLGATLIGSLAAARRGAGRTAGLLVGAATFIKPYTVLLAPWLAAAAGAIALVFGAVAVAAGLALPVTVYGWAGNLHLLSDWFRTVTETTAPNLLLPENVSLVSAWAKWMGPGTLATSLAVASSVAALSVAGLVLIARRGARAPDYLEFSLLLLLIPLLTPQGWDYMLLLGTPAIACLIDRWRDLGRGWQAATGAAFVVIGVPMREIFGLTVTREATNTGLVTVAALVLVAGLTRLRLRRAA